MKKDPNAVESEVVQEEKHDTENEEVTLWKDKYLRALADYQNLEKRSQIEALDIRVYAAEKVLTRLLPVVDTFMKAKTHLKDPGLDLALQELVAVLAEQGVEKIDVLGKQFDPHLMECIEVVEGQDNKVMEEIIPGYRLHDKIMRVAHVKVGKSQESTNDKSTNKQVND